MDKIWCILFSGIILDMIFIAAYYRNRYRTILFFKVASSIMFVVMGLIFAAEEQQTWLSWLIAIGLMFGLIGDFFLDAGPVFPALNQNSFTLGCGSFLIGHLFYIARSVILVSRSGSWMLIVVAAAGCIVGGYLIKLMFKVCQPPKDVLTTGVLYLLVLDFSCFLACGLAVVHAGSIWMAAGTALFAISDHMLTYDYFGVKKIVWFHGVLLILYYLAQCFIAFSILG